MTPTVRAAYAKLLEVFRDQPRVLVAFSGGIDSLLVLRGAIDALGAERVEAITAVSPALAEDERLAALELARSLGAPHRLIESHELADPRYRANASNRCFYCKTELYRLMVELAAENPDALIVNGTNMDDLGDHRPGLVAAEQAGVRSPLVEAGLGKEAVRALARELGLSIWDKPASPCLASRIPYGSPVTRERLERIERAEHVLRNRGFREFRVRFHETIARLELAPDEFKRLIDPDLRREVSAQIRQAGFQYVCVDLMEFRSGRLNTEHSRSPVAARIELP